jgi:hypothetical protein
MSDLNEVIVKIGNRRWIVCALLFFTTTVNYIDSANCRQLHDNIYYLRFGVFDNVKPCTFLNDKCKAGKYLKRID